MQATIKNPSRKKQPHFWPIMALYFLVIGSALLLFSVKDKKIDVVYLNQRPKLSANLVVLLNSDKILGNYLVDKSGRTLYTFKNDGLNESKCLDECSQNWPPLLLEANAGLGLGLTGVLGAIERSDGQIQLTYNSQPLYLYIKDKQMGDALGQGINKLWYIAKP